MQRQFWRNLTIHWHVWPGMRRWITYVRRLKDLLLHDLAKVTRDVARGKKLPVRHALFKVRCGTLPLSWLVFMMLAGSLPDAEWSPGRETLVFGHLEDMDGKIPSGCYLIFFHLWHRVTWCFWCQTLANGSWQCEETPYRLHWASGPANLTFYLPSTRMVGCLPPLNMKHSSRGPWWQCR